MYAAKARYRLHHEPGQPRLLGEDSISHGFGKINRTYFEPISRNGSMGGICTRPSWNPIHHQLAAYQTSPGRYDTFSSNLPTLHIDGRIPSRSAAPASVSFANWNRRLLLECPNNFPSHEYKRYPIHQVLRLLDRIRAVSELLEADGQCC
jgi:hypothetical protein